MTDTAIVAKLSRSYTVAGNEADSISFRVPKLADLLDVERAAIVAGIQGSHGMTALMIAQLSDATMSEIGEFSMADYATCDRAISPFMKTAEGGGGG